MNKQIEKIARVIKSSLDGLGCGNFNFTGDEISTMFATELYNAGYRKQEWISVEQRLPDRNGRYLTHCNVEGQSLVCILYFCKVGGFNEGTVTHWMPLPMPPKGGVGE